MNRHQQQQRTETCRWECRDYRDRVDQAFVQHTEYDVDNEKRGDDQNRRARQRGAECLRITLKTGLERQGFSEFFLDLLDRAYCLSDGRARQQIERDCHRRKLTLMVDHKRRDLHHRVDQRR